MTINLTARLAYLSIIWGMVINLAVVLNLDFALKIAAGGQFQSFPPEIRIIYFFQLMFLIFQFKVFHQLVNGMKVKPAWLVSLFIFIGILGVILNLLSRSSTERWNAIPLAITVFAFWKFKKLN